MNKVLISRRDWLRSASAFGLASTGSAFLPASPSTVERSGVIDIGARRQLLLIGICFSAPDHQSTRGEWLIEGGRVYTISNSTQHDVCTIVELPLYIQKILAHHYPYQIVVGFTNCVDTAIELVAHNPFHLASNPIHDGVAYFVRG